MKKICLSRHDIIMIQDLEVERQGVFSFGNYCAQSEMRTCRACYRQADHSSVQNVVKITSMIRLNACLCLIAFHAYSFKVHLSGKLSCDLAYI